MDAPETMESDSRKVACDGGKGALGHPMVYLNIGEKEDVQCPYCGRLYVLSEKGKSAVDAH